MKIDIKKIAILANLEISPEEESKFDKQLNDILSYVEKIDSLDVKDIIPTSQVTGLENVTREDTAKESLTQEEALSGTQTQEKKMFKVTAILAES